VHGVKLIQVEMICFQSLQRCLELRLDSGDVSSFRLASQKDIFPKRRKCYAQFFLRLAILSIRGRDVEIVDAPFDGVGDNSIGRALFLVHDEYAAESDNREFDFAFIFSPRH
jgi:hypothetical protein